MSKMISQEKHEASLVGLKRAIGKEANIRRKAENILEDMNILFSRSVAVIFKMGGNLTADIMIWEYVDINKNNIWWKGQSKELGIFTHIGKYINKKGVESLAHYSIHNTYISPAKKGDLPISYMGYFPVKKELYNYKAYDKSPDWKIEFTPKPINEQIDASLDSSDDEE